MGVVLNLDGKMKQEGSVQPLVDLTRADMARVNELILSRAASDVEMIPEVANHLISSGGKRLRPMMTLASARMFGYEGDGHVRLATSVEFMHTATLLHDDVVDESDLRRGKSTARTIWGNQASVLVGDFLLGQAFKMMVDVGSLDALDVLATSASIIAEGEVMQLAAAKNMETTEDEYLAVIKAKTAALFQRPRKWGRSLPARNAPTARPCAITASIWALLSSLLTMRLIMAVRLPISARIPATISAKARSRFPSSSAIAVAPTRSALSGKGLSKAARATTLPCRRQSA